MYRVLEIRFYILDNILPRNIYDHNNGHWTLIIVDLVAYNFHGIMIQNFYVRDMLYAQQLETSPNMKVKWEKILHPCKLKSYLARNYK